MKDDLVEVYESETLMEAQLVSARLEEAQIQCFIDNVDSPLDGLVAADQMKIVRVLPQDVDQARQVIAEFEAEK